jgi:uncharacterized protein (UPF0335 family)
MTENRPSEASFIKRLHALESERRTLAEDIKELKIEAKSHDYTPDEIAAWSAAVKLDLQTPDQAVRRDKKRRALADLAERLGGLKDLPLGQAAIDALT